MRFVRGVTKFNLFCGLTAQHTRIQVASSADMWVNGGVITKRPRDSDEKVYIIAPTCVVCHHYRSRRCAVTHPSRYNIEFKFPFFFLDNFYILLIPSSQLHKFAIVTF